MRLMLRRKQMIVTMLIMPLVFLIFMGNSFGGNIEHIPIAIAQENDSIYASNAAAAFNGIKTFQIKYSVSSQDQAEKLIKEGMVKAAIIIPSDFPEKLKSGEANIIIINDGTSQVVSQAATAVAKEVASHIPANTQSRETSSGLGLETKSLFGQNLRYIDFLAPGIVAMTVMMTGYTTACMRIVFDKQFGMFDEMLIAPIPRRSIVLGYMLSALTRAFIQGWLFLSIAVLLAGASFQGGITSIALVSFLIIITTLGFTGIGTALASRLEEMESVFMTSQIMIFPLFFVSGAIWPLEGLPDWMRPIAVINPLTYATDAMRNVILKGTANWLAIGFDILILSCFASVMFLIGAYLFRKAAK